MAKKYYNRFAYGDPNDVGIPGETTSAIEAIGNVAVSFTDLEDQIALSISFMLKRGERIGRIVTAELSFKNKLQMFSSLFRVERPNSDRLPMLNDLIGVCKEAEQLRNQVVHSSWALQVEDDSWKRRKYTAKMNGNKDRSKS